MSSAAGLTNHCKEDYAVTTRIAPSAALEAAIEEFLAEGLGDGERLAEIGRLGARLVLQRAVEEEVTAFLGRARYQRTPEARGSRNGNRPRQVQTAEGELEIQVPQIRGAAGRFVSSVIPNGRTALRTRPLEALIIGGCVRATRPSAPEAWARSSCWCCSVTRSTCRPGRAVPRRGCWWPGATTRRGSGCCWTSCWASGSASRTGWRWAAACFGVGCGRRCSWSPTERQG